MKQLNIVVVGKSGVGKSSLLNYIVGREELFQTGIGSPVTQEYFQEHRFQNNGVNYNLFDTKGIEPDNTVEFVQKIKSKIFERNSANSFFHHIHTIYYCFGANNKRIEPFEISFIKEINKETNVVVILTKSDLITSEVKAELINEVREKVGDDIHIVSVCSVSKNLRKGRTLAFGKGDILSNAFMGLWNTFSKKIPTLYEAIFLTKEEHIFSNDTSLKKIWFEHYDVNIFKKKDEKFVCLNQHALFNLESFFDKFLNSSEDKCLKFISLLLNRVKFLSWDELEAKHIIQNLILYIEFTYAEILALYTTLVGEKIDFTPLKKTKLKLYEFYNFYMSSWYDIILPLTEKYADRFSQIIKDPSWWGGQENNLLADFKKNYLDSLDKLYDALCGKISEIEEIYHTELYQFGELKLKNAFQEQLESVDLKYINHISDLNHNQKIFLNTILSLLNQNRVFDSNLRDKLDFLREALLITENSAGLIEDYWRRI